MAPPCRVAAGGSTKGGEKKRGVTPAKAGAHEHRDPRTGDEAFA
jgi:hypothetical protein